MIQHDAGHHRLTNRHGTDTDAGVVAALGDDGGIFTGLGDRAPFRQDGRGRLDREPHHNVLAGADAAQNSARMVRRINRAVRSH